MFFKTLNSFWKHLFRPIDHLRLLACASKHFIFSYILQSEQSGRVKIISLISSQLVCLTPVGHLYFGFGRKSTLFLSGLWILRLKFLSKAITATFKTRPRAPFPPVLRSGVPRQSEPGPQDLPVGRVQPGDVSPRGSGHHRERRGQSGPEERPAEVHGDVPHSFLPAG